MDTTEIIGLIASCIVLLSFLMPRIWLVRLISIISCGFFVVYGLMLDSWILWGLNGALIVIHLFYLLLGMRKKKRKKKKGVLCSFNQDTFGRNGLRKPNWFLTSRGDDYANWE